MKKDEERILCISEGCERTANDGGTLYYRCVARKSIFGKYKCAYEGCQKLKGYTESKFFFHHHKMRKFIKDMQSKTRK